MLDNIRIGYACTPSSLPFKTSRSFILKNFNEDRFFQCVKENLDDLMSILKWNVENSIYMFRISSDIIPFGSHIINTLKWWDMFNEQLLTCGAYIKLHKLRVSMHPGQYTVLNSPKEDVVIKSISDIEYHCNFLDSLGVDYTNKIILHVGGVYGDKYLSTRRFIDNFKRLSSSAQKRLVIENDDKSYTVEDVLSICKELNIPAVFDNLHHKMNPCSLTFEEILKKVSTTWKKEDGKMKVHYSDQDLEKKNGAHSQFVISENFLNYIESLEKLPIDIMLEVKDKEISAIKCVNLLKSSLKSSVKYTQWAKYKYSVMEKNYLEYKKCSKVVNSTSSMKEVYKAIDTALSLPFNEGNFINGINHVYGYLKDKVTPKEKEAFFTLLENPIKNRDKIKGTLKRLSLKYDIDYLNKSYYFIY